MQLRNDPASVRSRWSERDSQRSRVYAAEHRAWDGTPEDSLGFPEIEDVSREVKRLVNSRRLWKAFPFMQPSAPARVRREFVIKDGRGSKKARGGPTRLVMPRHQRRKWVILHELAHLLHGREQDAVKTSDALVESDLYTRRGYTSPHGWRYCMIYMQLVRWFVGAEAHDRLKVAFKQGRVKFRPPRIVSPEQRAALAERLAKLRPKADYYRREGVRRQIDLSSGAYCAMSDDYFSRKSAA